MPADRKPLDAIAFGLMTLLCVVWGFHQVTIRAAAPDVSLVMQAAIRSIVATALLCLWAGWRGIALFGRDGTLLPGLVAGAMFAGEFVFIYAGLAYTTASRMVVFIYLTPCITALLLPAFVPSERLRARQWAGVLLAFGGIVAAFAEGFSSGRSGTLRGDLYGVAAAVLWAATIVVMRATKLAHAPATKTLFYQLGASALVLPFVSLALGEPGIVRVTPLAIASLAFQGLIVAFASYLAWFWLLTRYFAARLATLTFMSPLFGVAFGAALLAEPVTPAFIGAALAVAGGIVLVNLPGRAAPR
ncbi:MAG TPA: DMT family transporter [Burkholderiales bacterium]|nr:DMT family transporter [Burkholderiales bacterium]